MNIIKGSAVVAISGLLLAATWVPSSAEMPAASTAAETHTGAIMAADVQMSATESSLEPSLALQAARQVLSNCKASHMYGADNLVGNPKACIMGGYGIAGAYGYGGVGMATGGR
jgi:hypothetical protein